MGQLDAMIPGQWEFGEEENTLPTWSLSVAASGFARLARAGAMTDVRGFAETVRWAIHGRRPVHDSGMYARVILNDLRQVLIGDGWTTAARNHGPFALKFNSFLDTGFKPEFRDGGNQVQHAMAGIYIRYNFGWMVSKYVYHDEDEKPDLALYRETFEIAEMLDSDDSIEFLPELIMTRLAAPVAGV